MHVSTCDWRPLDCSNEIDRHPCWEARLCQTERGNCLYDAAAEMRLVCKTRLLGAGLLQWQTSWTGSPLTWSDDGAGGAGCLTQPLKSSCTGWKEKGQSAQQEKKDTDLLTASFLPFWTSCFFTACSRLTTLLQLNNADWTLWNEVNYLSASPNMSACGTNFMFICVGQ